MRGRFPPVFTCQRTTRPRVTAVARGNRPPAQRHFNMLYHPMQSKSFETTSPHSPLPLSPCHLVTLSSCLLVSAWLRPLSAPWRRGFPPTKPPPNTTGFRRAFTGYTTGPPLRPTDALARRTGCLGRSSCSPRPRRGMTRPGGRVAYLAALYYEARQRARSPGEPFFHWAVHHVKEVFLTRLPR